MKKIALVVLAAIGYICLLPLWPGRRKNKLMIIRYHSVGDFRRHEVNVKASAFRKQMRFLNKYLKPISLESALHLLRGKLPIPTRAVVVTFDDGYKDNYINAYPVLKSQGIPATIFLTAGYIGSGKILPHDKGDNPAYNQFLAWYEVKQMASAGIEFGSHTINHANLGSGRFDIQSEIEDSKKIIEKELGAKVRAISYPFGLITDFGEEAKRISVKSGYACGCSAMNGVNDFNSDMFELRRIGIEGSDNMFTFRAKLNGALDLLEIKDWPVFIKILNMCNRMIGV
ncbi:MAG: polysaccharide deacetylase family protein [Candidatus Omnitrophica bacterium]|nr:polysaccharide deacetylase family protein [Candidatus Omnitrophota bacterium]